MTAFIHSHLDMALAPVGTSFLTEQGDVAATGGLGWSAACFWAATLSEFHAALRGRDGAKREQNKITPAEARREARAAGFTIFGEED
ncbi:MAG: hypothetical protein ACSHXI_06985 [Hoeflea sp.]|uniref:hypothetical protein n=1 Tax=Hoeflea sp. TaxID=1940281 RepID=UPI003EF1B463